MDVYTGSVRDFLFAALLTRTYNFHNIEDFSHHKQRFRIRSFFFQCSVRVQFHDANIRRGGVRTIKLGEVRLRFLHIIFLAKAWEASFR